MSGLNIIIVGAGKVGTHLCQILTISGHDITVIEKDERKCEELLSKVDVNVIKGNATDPEILEEAKIAKCDIFIASSDRDDVNFLTSMHAKNQGVKRIISRVNEPEYEDMLNDLGIETITPDISTAREIDLKIIKPTVAKLVLPGVGDIEILEIELSGKSPYIGKKLSSLQLKDCKFIVVHKKTGFMLHDDYVLEEGDVIIILCRPSAIKSVMKFFEQPKGMLEMFRK